MRAIEVSHVTDSDFKRVAAIADEAKVTLSDCYQCGKCTGGCPMIGGMDLMPRQVVRYLQLGLIDEVLQAKTPWVCAQCLVCSARCPQNVDIAALMSAVRHASKDAGYAPVPESDKFEDQFIKNIAAHGRSNEQYLAMKYNLRSGHLLQDMGNAPRMMKRGMIGIATHNIGSRRDVAELIRRATAGGAAKKQKGGEE